MMPSPRTTAALRAHLRLPWIAATMLYVSGAALVAAACRAGIIGTFPALSPHVARRRTLDDWFCEIKDRLADTRGAHGPVCVNIVMQGPDVDAHVACVIRHKAPMVIASVASPKAAVARLREAELVVFSDVASLAHARKAIDAGADGLVLLTAGAGGHTDWLNGLAFAREVLPIFDGPVVLAGGVCDGAALLAARALDCDFGNMGAPFAATRESLVSDVYRDRLIAASMDEIVLTKEFSGLWGNYLRESISAAGYDPDNLDAVDPATATIKFGPSGKGPKRWTQLQSAGHWVSSVRERLDAAGLMDRLEAQYRAAFATLAPPQRVWIN